MPVCSETVSRAAAELPLGQAGWVIQANCCLQRPLLWEEPLSQVELSCGVAISAGVHRQSEVDQGQAAEAVEEHGGAAGMHQAGP